MKKIKFASLLVVIISALTFISCDNEPIDSNINLGDFNNGNNGGSTTNGNFKVDFNGQTWTSASTQTVLSDNTIQIIGLKTDGSAFEVSSDNATVGTYPANQNLLIYNPAASQFGYVSINFQDPNEDTGSITITNIDTVNKKISGTFTFKGYWTNADEPGVVPINFTNGTFTNISYTSINPPPSTSTDLFFAKVDGPEFVENNIDVAEVIASGFPDSYSIVASKSNGDNIGLRFSKTLPVGNYAFDGAFNQDLASTCKFNNSLYTSETGSFKITSKTATRITGTFNIIVSNFSTSDVKIISEGSFDVELP